MADRLHEVGLPEAGGAADEEGVVPVGGLVGDVECGGVRELVRGADDEVLERVERIEITDLGSRRSQRTCGRDGGPVVVLAFQDEADLARADAGEARRFTDLVAVFARDVVDEEGAADEDIDGVGRLELLPRSSEPGIEVALVHPGLQVFENFLPGGRFVHGISTEVRKDHRSAERRGMLARGRRDFGRRMEPRQGGGSEANPGRRG